ncbi:MAG: hypothetical protein M0009_08875 [Deltaproteobacteria bacterium]|nr:hypothetical protein [Deltaproteobacteria bacterium]
MNTKERIQLQDEIRAVFDSGDILSASEEKLQEYMASLCLEPVANESMRHAKIIQALTINHIQMKRHIGELNQKNTTLQYLVIALAIFSIIGTAIQSYIAIRTEIRFKPIAIQQPIKTPESTKSISKTSKVSYESSKNKTHNKS